MLILYRIVGVNIGWVEGMDKIIYNIYLKFLLNNNFFNEYMKEDFLYIFSWNKN